MQALLIAFAFGVFIEGAAGFGTPVAVAAAATGLPRDDEARLFRTVLKHSLLLMALIGAIVVLYSHWGVPGRDEVRKMGRPVAGWDETRFLATIRCMMKYRALEKGRGIGERAEDPPEDGYAA